MGQGGNRAHFHLAWRSAWELGLGRLFQVLMNAGTALGGSAVKRMQEVSTELLLRHVRLLSGVSMSETQDIQPALVTQTLVMTPDTLPKLLSKVLMHDYKKKW